MKWIQQLRFWCAKPYLDEVTALALNQANEQLQQAYKVGYEQGCAVGFAHRQLQGSQAAIASAQEILDLRTGSQEELDRLRQRQVH